MSKQTSGLKLLFFTSWILPLFWTKPDYVVFVCVKNWKQKTEFIIPVRQIRYSQKQKSSGLTSSIEIDFNHFPHNTFNPLHSSQAPSDLHDPTISSVVFKWPVDGLKLTAHSRVTPQRYWAVMRTRPRPENPLNPEESIERQSPEEYKIEGY